MFSKKVSNPSYWTVGPLLGQVVCGPVYVWFLDPYMKQLYFNYTFTPFPPGSLHVYTFRS